MQYSPLLALVLGVITWTPTCIAQTVPAGFSVIDVNTSLDSDAVAFAVLPDGRILFTNQSSSIAGSD